MVYKTYKYIDKDCQDKYIILEFSGDVDLGSWYFDTDEKPDSTIMDWEDACTEA